MNLDTLAFESQATITTNTDADCAADQASEITPMPMECFSLVGGGTGIVLLG
jgi:hypothetical protein